MHWRNYQYQNKRNENNKYIRLHLLAGLIDSKGEIIYKKNIPYIKISDLNENLLKSVNYLIHSLGYISSCDNTNIIISGSNLDLIPIKLNKNKLYKKCCCINRTNTYDFNIKYIGKNKFYGWQVDGNERFLLGNFIITHNSRLRSKDYAAPRYIWTMFDELTTIIFNPNDNPILNHQLEDGIPIEPEFYAPIIPMILVNGTEGIGTGFSTKVPPYNPIQIINNIKNIINDKPIEDMDPWWQGFNGKIVKVNNYNYEIYGKWEINNNKLIITELPVGEWTSNYKEFLEKFFEEPKSKKTKKNNPLLNYKDNNTDTTVYFELLFEDNYLDTCKDIEKIYHLCKKYSISNMHLYSPQGSIKKYNDIKEIIRDYYSVRLDLYKQRRQWQLNILEFQLKLISYKVKFILMIINNEIDIHNKKKYEIELMLENNNFPRLGKSNDDQKISYDYLLTMPLYNLTNEKIEDLKKQRQDKEIEYNELLNKTEKMIWLEELNLLEQKYIKWYNKKFDNIQMKSKNTKQKK